MICYLDFSVSTTGMLAGVKVISEENNLGFQRNSWVLEAYPEV